VRNKAQVFVFAALKEIRENLPFPLLGIDSDNGSEFINKYLVEYCDKQKLSFTRSRPYRKNDNCFVEQKNYSIVRRAVGYQRYDTEVQLGSFSPSIGMSRIFIRIPPMDVRIPRSVIMAIVDIYPRPSLVVIVSSLTAAVFIVNASTSSRWTKKGIRFPPTSYANRPKLDVEVLSG